MRPDQLLETIKRFRPAVEDTDSRVFGLHCVREQGCQLCNERLRDDNADGGN
jgi:hypothetical protein